MITTNPPKFTPIKWMFLSLGALVLIAILIWQGIFANGAPDPTAQNLSPISVILSSGILVFREGLEAILVLAAVTAGAVRNQNNFWRPVITGVVIALIATAATWFIVIYLISSINLPALQIQAATGLLAIIVLLVVMNWFFHKIYWTGWISHHGKRRNKLIEKSGQSPTRVYLGLALLGFTAIYREGFEVVLFLQDLRIKAGDQIILTGAGIGIVLTVVAGILTFYGHQKLQYKKMLVFTGVMLAGVLFVMVGESAQEMQLAGWLSVTPLNISIPEWLGTWFAIFPNAEGLIAQVISAMLVIGSYIWVRNSVPKPKSQQKSPVDC